MSLIVEITPIVNIQPHDNANTLEIAVVKGWSVVVKKDTYSIGEDVIYIPIDAVLPLELSDRIGVTNYLSKGRVRTARLRGVYSQGLIIPISYYMVEHHQSPVDGRDIAVELGIKKYEPVIPIHMAGQIRCFDDRFKKYPSIEHYKNFPDVLVEGEPVHISEKIHGTNFRVMFLDGEIHVGTHQTDLKESKDNLYWRGYYKYQRQIDANLTPGLILFGEIYGKGVQKLHYGLDGIDVRFYDIFDTINHEWYDAEQLIHFFALAELPSVPIIYTGAWSQSLTLFAEGQSTIANHIREGIVIKPLINRDYPRLRDGRIIFKHINEAYLMKDYGDLH